MATKNCYDVPFNKTMLHSDQSFHSDVASQYSQYSQHSQYHRSERPGPFHCCTAADEITMSETGSCVGSECATPRKGYCDLAMVPNHESPEFIAWQQQQMQQHGQPHGMNDGYPMMNPMAVPPPHSPHSPQQQVIQSLETQLLPQVAQPQMQQVPNHMQQVPETMTLWQAQGEPSRPRRGSGTSLDFRGRSPKGSLERRAASADPSLRSIWEPGNGCVRGPTPPPRPRPEGLSTASMAAAAQPQPSPYDPSPDALPPRARSQDERSLTTRSFGGRNLHGYEGNTDRDLGVPRARESLNPFGYPYGHPDKGHTPPPGHRGPTPPRLPSAGTHAQSGNGIERESSWAFATGWSPSGMTSKVLPMVMLDD